MNPAEITGVMDAGVDMAVAEAMTALGFRLLFTGHHTCSCGENWDSEWSCACDDDECPACGQSVSPYDWDTEWV